MAALSGASDVAAELLRHGAEVTAVDDDGKFPMFIFFVPKYNCCINCDARDKAKAIYIPRIHVTAARVTTCTKNYITVIFYDYLLYIVNTCAVVREKNNYR